MAVKCTPDPKVKKVFNKLVKTCKNTVIQETTAKVLMIISLCTAAALFIGGLTFDTLLNSGSTFPEWQIYVMNIMLPFWMAVYLYYSLYLLKPKLLTKRLLIFLVLTYITLNPVIIVIAHLNLENLGIGTPKRLLRSRMGEDTQVKENQKNIK